LTRIESIWKHLHEQLGTWDRGRISAKRFRDGEITYEEWAKMDALCWKGLEVSSIIKILDGIEYTQGAKEALETLRTYGIRTAIVSAGLSILAEKARRDLNADLAIANELEVRDGKLTGNITVRVDPRNKREVIEEIALLVGVEMSRTAVIGDNPFDLHEEARLNIAFNPREKWACEIADIVIESKDLRDIIGYILFNDRPATSG
jgi:phosphoserine phosphatase